MLITKSTNILELCIQYYCLISKKVTMDIIIKQYLVHNITLKSPLKSLKYNQYKGFRMQFQ